MRADIAIIGTGPAGISAAITAKVRNKNILLFGSRDLSEKITKAHTIFNYPGLPEIKGEDMAEVFSEQLRSLDIEITEKKVNIVYPASDYFSIQAGGDIYEADSVILASGVVTGKQFIGENEFLGRGVSYCATCDAMFYREKQVAVIGYNEEAVKEAEYLAEIAGQVYFFPMGKIVDLKNVLSNIQIINETPLEIKGDLKVCELLTKDKNGRVSSHNVDGVFILRDAIAPDQLVTGLETNENHVRVNLMMETNIKGLFACGDIVGKPYQYIKAAGQGNVAALSAVSYLSEKSKKNN